MFDYFLVFGLHTNKADITLTNLLNETTMPEIQHIYPNQDEQPMFIENLKLWCFPDGVLYYSDDLKPLNHQLTEQFSDIRSRDQLSHFVLTDEKGQQRFCTSMLYYEIVYVRNQSKHHSKLSKCMPKIALKQIIKNPLILDEDTQIIYAPRSIVLISQTPIFDLQRQFLVFMYNNYVLEYGEHVTNISQDHYQQFEQLVLKHGLGGAEVEWNKLGNIRYLNSDQNILIEDKQLMEFYVSILFTINRNIITEDNNQDIRITRFDVNEEMLRFRMNDSEILSISNFTYRPLFNRLSFVNIMRIVISIIYEKQILFFSSNIGEIAQITEGLLSFIRPLKWSNIYIPCSNIKIWEYVTALQPYIIGFDKQHKEFIMQQVSNRVIVDLDDDQVIENANGHIEEQLSIPEELLIELKQQLREISISLEYSANKKVYQWMEAVLKTKKAFFCFIVKALQNVLPYIKPLETRDNDRGFITNLKQCFDIDLYIKQHKYPKFIEPIAKNTMIFGSLIQVIDDYVSLGNSVDSSVLTYINLMNNEQLQNSYDKTIEINLAYFQMPYTFDLYPYLIKYKKYRDIINSTTDQEHQKQQSNDKQNCVLHFYDDISRQNTRLLLNMRENRFSKFDTRRIVNLVEIFNSVRVNQLLIQYKPQVKSQEQTTQLQKKKSQYFRRQSAIVQDNWEDTKEDIKVLIGSIEKRNLQ